MTSPNGNIFRVTGPLCEEFTGEFPSQRPVTRSLDVFFNLRLNKRLSKQSRRRWFETPLRWYGISGRSPMRSPENARKRWIWPVSLGFFGLCDLEICYMTLEIWEPQAVGVSYHLIKYQGNRWWNMLSQRLGQTDKQTDGRTICRSEEWHTLHTITPNKWPKHKRKNLWIRNGAWAYMVLRRCQTNVLP